MRKFRINRYGLINHIFDVEMKVWYGWTLVKRFKASIDNPIEIKYAQKCAQDLLEMLDGEYTKFKNNIPIPSFDEILEANKDVLKQMKELDSTILRELFRVPDIKADLYSGYDITEGRDGWISSLNEMYSNQPIQND